MAGPGFYPSLEPWVRADPADWPPIKRPGLRTRQGVTTTLAVAADSHVYRRS
ncbi:hypothetical protein GCM10010400_40150 [Streptomyces aculeolatus]